MNEEKLAAYIALYEEGAFLLRTEKDWAALYAVATPRNNIMSRHFFQIPCAKKAYDYGYKKTPHKAIYQKELILVPEDKASYKLAFGKINPLWEPDGRIQFRGKN